MEARHQIHLHLRPAPAELVHHGHQPVEAGMALQHDAQLAARVAFEPGQVALGRADGRQRLARQRQQPVAGRGEAQALAGAVEQRQAVMRLDAFDLMGQRGLADVHALRGHGELAGLGNRHQRAQVPDFDHGLLLD